MEGKDIHHYHLHLLVLLIGVTVQLYKVLSYEDKQKQQRHSFPSILQVSTDNSLHRKEKMGHKIINKCNSHSVLTECM